MPVLSSELAAQFRATLAMIAEWKPEIQREFLQKLDAFGWELPALRQLADLIPDADATPHRNDAARLLDARKE